MEKRRFLVLAVSISLLAVALCASPVFGQGEEGFGRQQGTTQRARVDFLLGTWNYTLQGNSQGGSIKNWGTVTMTRKDNMIYGYELTTTRQFFNNPVEYVSNPKQEIILRGTLPDSDSGDIKWEVWRVAPGNPLSPEAKMKFETVRLSISQDGRRISFKYPAVQYDLKGRGSDYYLDYILTR